MYASVRIHHFVEDAVPAVLDWVREDFARRIETLPGFVAYYGIEIGEGRLLFVSIFETLDAAESAHRQAMMWAESFWDKETVGMVKHYVGSVSVVRTSDAGEDLLGKVREIL